MPSPPSVTRPRLPPYLLLDAWRGIAALWVVMVHSCLAFIANGHPDALRNPVYGVSVWGQLGVVLFFVISGYCIAGAAHRCIDTGKSLGRYASDRFRRIFPPYLAACAAALLVAALTTGLQRWHVLPASASVRSLPFHSARFWLANLTLTQFQMGAPPLLIVAWSLCYEIAFYALVGTFLALSALVGVANLPGRGRFLTYVCGVTTVASLAWLVFSPATCPFPFDRWYQFGFGAILFALISGGNWRSSPVVTTSAAVSVALCVCYACRDASPAGYLGHPSVRVQAWVCVCFFLTLLFTRPVNERLARWRPVAPLMWLGTFSYSIYLVHLIALPFPDAGLRRIGFDGPWYLLTYFVELLVGIGAGWLFFVLVERRFISTRQEKRIEAELHPPALGAAF